MSAAVNKKDPVIFFIKVRFLVAFLFLALLAAGTFLLLIYEVNKAQKDSLVITVMENQEGAIHKATFLAGDYARSNNFRERQALRKDVHDILALILAFPSGYQKDRVLKASVPGNLQREIYDLYCRPPSRLNEEVTDYIASVKNFMLGAPSRVSSDYPLLKSLNTQTLRVLDILRSEVRRYQYASRKHLFFLKDLGLGFFIMTIIALLVVAIFVFMPVIRRVEAYFYQLKNMNQALEEKVQKRTLELEQKATELSLSNHQLQDQIRERLRAEEDLRSVNIFLDSVIENIPDMIFIKDADELRFVRFNKAGENLIGYPRGDLLGKNDYALFPKDQADFFIQKDRETLKNKVLVEITEEPINTKQKGGRVLHTKKIPILDKTGKPVYLLGISEDITDRIVAEKQLRESLMAMENALDGIARLDKDTRVLQINKAGATMLGYTPEELVGVNRLTTICVEDRDKAKEALQEMKTSGKAETEVKAIRKDGTIIYQYVVFIRALDKNGNYDGLHCFSKDITERKYRESLEIKSDLIQMVSHELRTPIHSVKEGLSIVLEGLTGQLGPEQKEVLEISKRCADRLARLVNDVLAFHKLEAGVIEFRIKKTNINALITDVVNSMGPLVKEKNLRLEVKLDSNLPEIDMDRDKIMQVVTNFFQNAIKFTPQGSIMLSTSSCLDGIRVAIQDSGIGIQQKDLDKIFRKFGQLEAAKSIAPGGTGLGLAISKKIIEEHHGKVFVESEYKKGSTFSFTLPLVQPVKLSNGKT